MKGEHAYDRNLQCVARRPVTVIGGKWTPGVVLTAAPKRQVPRSSLSGLRNGALGFKVEHLLPWMGYYLTIKNDFLRALFSNVGGHWLMTLAGEKQNVCSFLTRTCGSGERETFTFHFKALTYY